MGTSFSNYLYLLVEKILLSRVSPLAMEAAVNASYGCQIFQGATIAFAMMAQVFVGRWFGSRSYSEIGPGIWQFIWFSVLSMLLTVPLGLLYGHWYFTGTDIEGVAYPYYRLLTLFNFIYPLSVALSCFYLGRGKTKFVLVASLCSQVLKLGIAPILIFGFSPWIEPQGAIGGAISTIIAQIFLCGLLGITFFNKQNRIRFNTGCFQLKFTLFNEIMGTCGLRVLNRILTFTCWALIARLMSAKGGAYLMILSLGGTLSMFLPFLFEAICQAQTTTVSYLIGLGSYEKISKAIRSGFLLVVLLIILIGIPLLFFHSYILQWFFPSVYIDVASLNRVFLGIWLSFAFFTLNAIPVSHILAYKDTFFSLCMGVFNWINGYLLMYLLIQRISIQADQFWIGLSLMHGTTFLLYFMRMKMLTGKKGHQLLNVTRKLTTL